MKRASVVVLALAVLVLSQALLGQDAKTVVADASRAMGLDGVTSLYYYGAGATFTLGQNNNANIPWPRNAINDYTRAIDFSVPASRATWATYAVPVQGGAAVLATPQQNITADHTRRLGTAAGDLDDAVGIPQGRRGQQPQRQARDHRRQALPGRELGRTDSSLPADRLTRWSATSIRITSSRR